MRLIMTEEMLVLWNEIKPYYDGFHLRTDTPDEIKQKQEKLHEMQDKQYAEAMKLELGFDWNPKTA